MSPSAYHHCIHCREDLVQEEAGFRLASRDLTRDRVACEKSPTGRHEPADQMRRIPVQAVTECPCGFRAGDLA